MPGAALTDLDRKVRAAALLLRVGGIVAYPTDTLYGLGVDAFNAAAVERVFLAKGRARDQGLPVLLADASQLELVATNVSHQAMRLAEHFWPGALTIVLRRSPDLPAVVSGGAPTVAVRVPNHEVPVRLVRELDSPITGTSANKTGAADPVSVEEVEAQLGPWLDYIIDLGPAPQGEASTIVDMSNARPRILREGAISTSAILEALNSAAGGPPERRRVR